MGVGAGAGAGAGVGLDVGQARGPGRVRGEDACAALMASAHVQDIREKEFLFLF